MADEGRDFNQNVAYTRSSSKSKFGTCTYPECRGAGFGHVGVRGRAKAVCVVCDWMYDWRLEGRARWSGEPQAEPRRGDFSGSWLDVSCVG